MSPLEEYLAVIRAPATRVVYHHCLIEQLVDKSLGQDHRTPLHKPNIEKGKAQSLLVTYRSPGPLYTDTRNRLPLEGNVLLKHCRTPDTDHLTLGKI